MVNCSRDVISLVTVICFNSQQSIAVVITTEHALIPMTTTTVSTETDREPISATAARSFPSHPLAPTAPRDIDTGELLWATASSVIPINLLPIRSDNLKTLHSLALNDLSDVGD